jgi:hypothetical protein
MIRPGQNVQNPASQHYAIFPPPPLKNKPEKYLIFFRVADFNPSVIRLWISGFIFMDAIKGLDSEAKLTLAHIYFLLRIYCFISEKTMLLEYEAKKVNWKKLFQELESEVRFFLFSLNKIVYNAIDCFSVSDRILLSDVTSRVVYSPKNKFYGLWKRCSIPY